MANASYNVEFQQTQSQARQTAQSFIPNDSAAVNDVMDMLGYEISTSLQERIDKSREKISRLARMEVEKHKKETKEEDLNDRARKDLMKTKKEKKRRKLKRHNEFEQVRRQEMSKQADKLSEAIDGPESPYTLRATMKERLESAINCIKNLKFDSSMLQAERYWLILENRELVERLQELRDGYRIHSIPRLWENGMTISHCHDTQWDEVTGVKKKSKHKDPYEREKHFNHCLENVRKQKMQLHEKFRRTSPDDAVPGEMGIGRWCTDQGCAAAPHRIHDGAWLEGSDSLWTPLMSLKEKNRDEDGGWLEDMSKTELDDNKCPGKHPVTLDKSRTAPKRKKNDFPAEKEMKGKKRSESKTGSGAFAFNAVKQKPVDTKRKVTGVYIPSQVPVGPKFIVTKDTGNSFSADGSNLFGGAHGKLIKHDSVDSSLSNRKLYVVDLWKMQGKTQKVVDPSSHPQVNLIPLTQGNAVLVYQPENLVSGSTSAQAPVTNVQPLVVPVSLTTTDVDPSTGNGQVSLKLLSASPSAGLSQSTVMKAKPQGALGSINALGLDFSKGNGQGSFKLLSVASSVGHSQPTVTKDQFRAAHGSLGVLGLDPSKGNGQADVMTVSAQAKVAQSKPEVTTSQQRAPGSVSLVKLDSKNVISERIKLVPVPTGDSVSQPTGTKDKYQVTGGSVSIVDLCSKIKKVQADVKALSAHQHGVELAKHNVTKVKFLQYPVFSGFQDLNSTKGNSKAEFKVAPEHANVGHSQPIMTQGGHRVNPGSIGTTAEAEADVTEEVDKCSSPISCMLCDKPFNNVTELQTHLIDSHS